MQTNEVEPISDGAVITLSASNESAPAAATGNYEAVRFNAMKHGILSRLTVLAHEDAGEFADLLAALIEEHRPAGMTERHLIEELATIIWRKRRVLLAEGAKINEGLKSAVNSAASVIKSAAPFQRGIGGENADLREFMDGTPDEIAERQRDAALDLAATQKAAAILRKGGRRGTPGHRRRAGRIHPRFTGTDLLPHGEGSPIYPGHQGANLGRRAAGAPVGETEPLRNAPGPQI